MAYGLSLMIINFVSLRKLHFKQIDDQIDILFVFLT